MKFKDYFNLKMEEYGKALKGDKTDKDLDVALEAQILPDDRVIEYEALEVEKEVFLITKDSAPTLIKDETIVLADGQSIVIDADGKISEIKPKEEEKEEPVELSEDQKKLIELAVSVSASDLEKLVNLKKNGYYTLTMSVSDGKIAWADLYTETYETLLSEQVDPIKIELEAEKAEVVKLKAQIIALQELNDEKNPLKKSVKLENEKPKTPYEIQIGA